MGRPRPVIVAIGMGGNVGRPSRAIRLAAQALSPFLRNPKISPIYRTSPVGGPPGQRDYLNAVLVGTTSLSAGALLTLLRNSETAAGRRRARGARNGPRPLDLDLLLYGKERIATRRLTVPHPRMTKRLFVLVPLADVAPRRVVPGTGRTVATLLAEARPGSKERVRPVRPPGASQVTSRREREQGRPRAPRS